MPFLLHADGVGRHFGYFERDSPLSRPQALHFFLPDFLSLRQVLQSTQPLLLPFSDRDWETGITQGGRFLYKLDEVFFENYLGLGVTTNNRMSTDDRFLGINLAEVGNTGEDGADDRVRSGLTAGQLEFFELLPTPEGAVVETWWTRCSGVSGETGSNFIYVFNRAGEFYGPC